MIKYIFQIDKEACFAYWVQSMIEWNWYFNKKNYDYYITITNELSQAERKALSNLKEILQQSNKGYLWLWDRYSGNIITNLEESKNWDQIKNILKDKFEKIWEEEYPKLIEWKNILEEYSFKKTADCLEQIKKLYESSFEGEVIVKLNINLKKNNPCGHVKKEYKNLILLDLSSLDEKFINKVLSALSHETVHLIDYRSDKSEIFKNSYLNIINPHKIKQKKPSWYHLITESVISSVAGLNFSYMTKKMFPEIFKDKNEKLAKFDYKNNKENYSYQIKSVAYNFKKITEEYLKEDKTIDKVYGDKVVQTWLDFRL